MCVCVVLVHTEISYESKRKCHNARIETQKTNKQTSDKQRVCERGRKRKSLTSDHMKKTLHGAISQVHSLFAIEKDKNKLSNRTYFESILFHYSDLICQFWWNFMRCIKWVCVGICVVRARARSADKSFRMHNEYSDCIQWCCSRYNDGNSFIIMKKCRNWASSSSASQPVELWTI